ncbi:glutamic acid-rich protein-like [Hylaeus anthracinus]|uniref:glutamic acid-rich protein-like n=1 Tax=Hylaeus anthracinus TaxID=313031 RepID=UPI0023B8C7CD|nr:glutamic acid-rich protein-like [Hylaeus anthracinus]
MVKNIKKRPVSESEAVGKVGELNTNKAQKKAKVENGAVRNDKGIKKDALKKLATEKKKEQGMGVVQSSVKKPVGEVSTDKNKKKMVDGKEEKQQRVKQQRLQYREKRKLNRQQKTKPGTKPELSVAEIKQKIEDIEKRGNLTKTAKRKLATLKKVLGIKEGTYKPKEQVAKKQAGNKSVEVAKKKQIQNNEQKKKLPEKPELKMNKVNKKKNPKQGNLLLVKQNDPDEDEDDDDDDDDDDVETDNDVEEEDEEDVDIDAEEEEEEEEDDDEDEEDEEENSEDDEDDDDDESEVDDEATTNNIQSPSAKEKSKQNTEQEGKKKRYVLFVGNLPYSITNEELKKHFLTKVSQVIDIRIPKKDANTSRGFAYVELANNTDYEKALALNHSFVNGRRINVQYSGGAGNKKEVVAKNFKLQALQKAGKLAGGYKKNNQKFGGKKWKQHRQTTKT